VVISGEVGLRKPEPAIYALAARSLGVEPSACVFVDDFYANLEPAQELGMATVLHTDAGQTTAALEELLGVRLRSAP
jgi:putative hydrolase of the HAD superfamily